jgi:predicted Zn-dependent protease
MLQRTAPAIARTRAGTPRPARWLRTAALAIAASLACAGAPQAQGRSLNAIRDAEIEQLLRDYATPIFRAARVGEGAVQMVLISDPTFNAFVANGRKVFINVGVLMQSETPNEVIGVLAHETGHIAGGHLIRLREEIERAQIIAVLGTLAGVAGAAASASSRNVGASGTGIGGLILGPQEMVRRSLLAYQRGEEQAADRAAVGYLNATRQSARGMLATFRRFADNSLFQRSGVDPYLQSHPMAPERIANLETVARQSPWFEQRDPPALQRRHDLARAKLFGFTARAEEVARRYPASDQSLAARYARAIIAYRFRPGPEAYGQIDALIREQPNNPFFWELKGQALLEGARAREAIAPLRRAVALAPGQPLIRGMLGHALVASGDRANLDAAVRELTAVTQRDPDNTEAFRHLAQAHAARGQEPLAALAAAQGYMASGQFAEARRQARRAQAGLTERSPAWLKADDIINSQVPGQN